MKLPRVMIAAQSSGSGKTMITCGILQALVNRGLKASSFKCGPDYIDPMFHSRVIGTKSRNLDAFFVDTSVLRRLFARSAEGSDISVIEGVMGFYDGIEADTFEGSSCDISLRLDTPVVIIIDCKGSSLTSLAVLKGLTDFDRNNIRGAIFNNMSEKVYRVIEPKVLAMGIVPVGYVPRLKGIDLESRHLGLVMPSEIPELRRKLNVLADTLEKTLDLDALIDMAEPVGSFETEPVKCGHRQHKVRIGVADDEAFCFTYEDNLELLMSMGAEIIPFSPIHDHSLPDVDALILSGGYPELHADALCSNRSMMDDIASKLEGGLPCIAECGGFMYLHERMEGSDGVMHEMCGAIRGSVRGTSRLVRFGYITLNSVSDGRMIPKGSVVKGHEFHYWDSDCCGEDCVATKVNGTEYLCIHDNGSMFAGFPHLYLYSNPAVAEEFVKRAEHYRNGRSRLE